MVWQLVWGKSVAQRVLLDDREEEGVRIVVMI